MNEPTIRHIDPGTPVDLTNCDREPIHLLGRVQSYGALVALSPDWVIQHASENLGTILDHDDGEVIGQNIDEIVDASAIARLRTAMTRGDITRRRSAFSASNSRTTDDCSTCRCTRATSI